MNPRAGDYFQPAFSSPNRATTRPNQAPSLNASVDGDYGRARLGRRTGPHRRTTPAPNVIFYRIYRGGTALGNRTRRTTQDNPQRRSATSARPGQGPLTEYWISTVDENFSESAPLGLVSVAVIGPRGRREGSRADGAAGGDVDRHRGRDGHRDGVRVLQQERAAGTAFTTSPPTWHDRDGADSRAEASNLASPIDNRPGEPWRRPSPTTWCSLPSTRSMPSHLREYAQHLAWALPGSATALDRLGVAPPPIRMELVEPFPTERWASASTRSCANTTAAGRLDITTASSRTMWCTPPQEPAPPPPTSAGEARRRSRPSARRPPSTRTPGRLRRA